MSTTTEDTAPGLERPTGDVYTPLPGTAVGDYKNHPDYKETSLEDVIRGVLTHGPITDNVVACHVAVWNAGWYHDLKTGVPKVMNAGERMLLMISELVEAQDGLDGGLMDDKLPHRRMVEVEIADFEIRLFDYCGAERYDLQAAFRRSAETEPLDSVIGVGGVQRVLQPLWQTTCHIGKAMEAHRKNRREEHVMCLARAYRTILWMARGYRYDIDGARAEKMAFNKVRPDHQKAARLAEDGKAY